MTEIPEHLLNRSKARRAAASGEGSADAPATTGSAPATTESAPARAAAAPVAKVEAPVPPVVRTAVARKKIPF